MMEGPSENLACHSTRTPEGIKGTKVYIRSQDVVAGHRLIQKLVRTSRRVSHRFVDLYLTIIFIIS